MTSPSKQRTPDVSPLVPLFATLFLLGCGSTVMPNDAGTDAQPAETGTGAETSSDAPSAQDVVPSPEASTGDAASDAAPNDARPDAAMMSGPCPATLPAMGDACTREGLACQYGDDPRNACRPTATCTSGRFTVQQPDAMRCPAITPAAMCPASREAAANMACTQQNAVCSFGGLTCTCTNCRSFPVGGCGGDFRWRCEAPAADQACPATVPRLGTTCAMEGQSCGYDCEAQGIEGGRRCMGGVWVSNANNCPISSRRAKRDVVYLDDLDVAGLTDAVLRTRLATYEYTDPALAGPRRLGFIIEDQPQSFSVEPERSQVDLYGFTSMLAAAVQHQSRQIAALRAELDAVRRRRR